MSEVSEVVDDVVAGYRRYTDAFREERADEVESVATVVDEIGYDNLSEYFLDLMDELREDLSFRASSRFEDEDDQEEAISSVEQWVSDNVSNQGSNEAVLAAFYLRGISRSDDIVNEIRSVLAKTAAP